MRLILRALLFDKKTLLLVWCSRTIPLSRSMSEWTVVMLRVSWLGTFTARVPWLEVLMMWVPWLGFLIMGMPWLGFVVIGMSWLEVFFAMGMSTFAILVSCLAVPRHVSRSVIGSLWRVPSFVVVRTVIRPRWSAPTGRRTAMRSRKNECVLGFESKPLSAIDSRRFTGTVIELNALWYGGQKERHPVVIQRGAPLSHRAVYRVEDVVGVVYGRLRLVRRAISGCQAKGHQGPKVPHGDQDRSTSGFRFKSSSNIGVD